VAGLPSPCHKTVEAGANGIRPSIPLIPVQNLPHFSDDGRWREGLLEEMYLRFQYATKLDGVVRITGHIKNLKILAYLSKAFGKLFSAHLGHNHIGQQQVDGARTAFTNQKGLTAMPRCQDFIATRGTFLK